MGPRCLLPRGSGEREHHRRARLPEEHNAKRPKQRAAPAIGRSQTAKKTRRQPAKQAKQKRHANAGQQRPPINALKPRERARRPRTGDCHPWLAKAQRHIFLIRRRDRTRQKIGHGQTRKQD
ncbi:hypothetical protein SDC9_212280 [bioreactor metagenome]|uniref:Uncharacterized protein n=1 Tax=bioreactor metagenome TaxID=1076179 RepID=A0A645JLG5_9ZZZZ